MKIENLSRSLRRTAGFVLALALIVNTILYFSTNGPHSVSGSDTPIAEPEKWMMDTDLSRSDASFIGEEITVRQGWSYSIAGDVNGDGYDDIIVGVPMNDRMWRNAGQTFLFFGGPSGWGKEMNLSLADASFLGEREDDHSGISVSGGGDVNGDGYDDILIGASFDDEGGVNAGQTYLILGRSSGWQMDTYLRSVDASFIGESAGDEAGIRVSIVGDVNNDGFDDILIGAHYNDEGGNNAGQTYLIFGKGTGWSMDTSLSSSDASFIGEGGSHNSGLSLAGAGDVNRDGYDDILIASPNSDEGGNSAGQAYLILGKDTGWTMDTNLSLSDASFIGEFPFDNAGINVDTAGDVNGDGYDDILIGAGGNDENGEKAGQAYLVLGKSSGWSMDTSLALSDASFIGEFPGDYAGLGSVAGVGDVNGDSFDDILIGAPYNDEGGEDAGQVYLIYGKTSGWGMDTNLSLSNASFIGESINDTAGYHITGGGDINGDGYDDLVICSRQPGGMGKSYLLFGYRGHPPEVAVDHNFIVYQLVKGGLRGEVEIRYTALDQEDGSDLLIDIFYQRQGGDLVQLLHNGENTGYYFWDTLTPRVPDGEGYFIWITAKDSDGNIASNRSEGAYEINNPDPPIIELTAPITDITITDLGQISWNAYDGEDEASELSINISISGDGGVSFDPVVNNIANTGQFQLHSRAYPDGETYKIKVTATDTEGMSSEDISGNFTIDNHPDFEFFTPSEGEVLTEDFVLYWKAVDPFYGSEELVIDIWIVEVNGTNRTLLAENEENDGVFFFDTMNFTDWVPYRFMVNVTNPYGLVTTAFSDQFTIFNNDGPVVSFIRPYENEVLTGTIEFTWNSWDDQDDPEDLAFALYYQLNGTSLWNEIALNAPNNGSYLWDTNDALYGDGTYIFRIALRDSQTAVSEPAYVKAQIYNPDPPEIKYPIGPREQVRDGTAEIEWIAEDPDPGETDELKVWIYYSRDGTTWTSVEEGIPNQNGYTWNVSMLEDGNYSLKLVVSDCQDDDFNRTTEHIFEDVVVNNVDDPPVIEFLSEGLGGEIHTDEILLIWKGEDPDGDGITYSLFYQKEGTEEWVPIPGAQDINETSYLWNISDMEPGLYRVKIVAKENFTLALEVEYITDTFEIRIRLGGDGEGERSVTINFGLLFGVGAGFVILALIIIYIMFLNVRKKGEGLEEEDMNGGSPEDEDDPLTRDLDEQGRMGAPALSDVPHDDMVQSAEE